MVKFMITGSKNELLIKACQDGNFDEAQSILNEGIDANVTDGEGRTPLMWASYNGHHSICSILLEKGASVDAKDNYNSTALMFAAQAGHKDICSTLLKEGAHVNLPNEDKKNPFDYALENNHVQICELLIESGADVNATLKDGKTLLMHAAQKGLISVCIKLIEKGALINVQDNLAKTPLNYASEFKEIKELLFTKGAYEPPAFIQACQNGNVDEVKALIDKGENINQIDQFGKTALYYVSLDFKPDIVKVLLERGVGLHIKELFVEPTDNIFSNLSATNKKVHMLLSQMSLDTNQINELIQILTKKAKLLVEDANHHSVHVEAATFALMTWIISLGHYTQEGLLEIKQAINALSTLWTPTDIENLSIGGYSFPSDFVKQFKINKLLAPTSSDSPLYKKLYYHLNELQECHMLGHRFGLKGKRNLLGVDITYQNAYASLMQKMLTDSYYAFHQANTAPIEVLQSVFEQVEEGQIKAILENIYQDVMQVNKINKDTAQRLNDNHNISITITSQLSFNSGHFTCMVGNNEFLVYGDRYPTENNGSGLEIMAFDEKTTAEEKIALLNSLSNKGVNELDNIQKRNFLAKIKTKFNLKTIYFLERSAQKADTCGWASSAKLVMQANAILHFYQLAKKLGNTQEDSFIKAQKAAKILYDAWSKDFDREKALKDYLNFHQNIPDEYKVEHDKQLLAMILLQSEQKPSQLRQTLKQTIQETGLIDDITRAQAQDKMTDIIEDHLEGKAMQYEELRDISFNTLASDREEKKAVFDEKRYTDTYLREGTKEADAEVENLVQETLRQRVRNKERREKEMLQNELTAIIDNWSVYSNVKFEEIKGKLEEILKKGANLALPDSNANYAIIKLTEKYIRHRYPAQGEIAKELDQCLKFLLSNGAPLSLEGKPLIHEVATEGALKCFLEKGVDIDVRDSNGQTLLMKYITPRNYTQGVEFLLKNGADVSLFDKEGHDAKFYAKQTDNEIIIKLLEERTKPNSPR